MEIVGRLEAAHRRPRVSGDHASSRQVFGFDRLEARGQAVDLTMDTEKLELLIGARASPVEIKGAQVGACGHEIEELLLARLTQKRS